VRTVPIFKSADYQVICLPVDMAYDGVTELEITRSGDVITLRPIRPSWRSFAEHSKADADFLQERPPVMDDEGRFKRWSA